MTREQKLMIDALCVAVAGQQRILEVQNVDWGKLQRFSQRHALAPMVCDGLQKAGVWDQVPGDVQNAFQTAYMKAIYGLDKPRVGLLNNGTEEHKGTPLQTEAYQLLKNCPDVNFVGNVESGMIPFDVCDVLVTDGFTGNVLLKSLEGMGKLVMTRMKGIFYATPLTKLAALTVKKPFTQFKKDFDVKEHGGSPILGLRKPVIKAHGSSDAKAFKSAIRLAMRFAESGATATIETLLGDENAPGRE